MKHRKKKPDPQPLIEYGLIASMIAVAIVGVLATFGSLFRVHDQVQAQPVSVTSGTITVVPGPSIITGRVEKKCKPRPSTADLLNALEATGKYRP